MQRLMMPCITRSFGPDPRMCDIKKRSICVDNTCVCVKGYIPNASGVCESKESYASYLKLNEYRVKPGEYCRENTDCIEGLVCNKFKCNCPSDCNYRQRKEVCDCGKVDTEVWPIIIGVLLGMIVIVFWIWAIRKTIIKHKEKIKHSSHRTAIDNDDVPASHPLTPFQSSAQTETVDNTASPVRRTTGTPISRDNNTPRTYSPISPTVPRYPVDPESDKPPSYEEVISSPLYNPDPTSLQKALHPNYYIPLSSGTQQSSGPSYSPSERPHSYNPSPATYPNSPYLLGPQFTTHRGSLDAIPHRVHPSATFNVASRSPPSYSSVPELQPPDNPNFHERSVSGSAGTHTDR
ncbi:uncharacterized protein LOC122256250 [Penaeus japonicus]|uniref:uncharacterized protein LOC122256250 n=1 Tax=Penaeus japonicus TaxID=27405 RepID=UPI001C710CB8|nr:uncharacterized protein LOC122256250 [Penaeus japonicus]